MFLQLQKFQQKVNLYISKEIEKLAVDAKKLALYREGTLALQNILFTLFLLLGVFFVLVKLEMSIEKIGLLGILFLRITQCFSTIQKFLQSMAGHIPLNKRVNEINRNLLIIISSTM